MKKSLNISSMIFQYGSAALLFWESVTSNTNFDLIGVEVQLQDFTRFPPTRPEKIMDRVSSFVSLLIFFVAVLAVALQIFALSRPGETEKLIKAESIVIGGGILLFGLIQYTGSLIQNSINHYASKMQKLEIEEERRQVAKRMIRQIAFVVFSIGSVTQIILAFVV